MTEFEAKSLAIATDQLAIATGQLYSYIVADAIALAALIAAIVAGWFAYKNAKIMTGNMLLFLEQDMAVRRRVFHDIETERKAGASTEHLAARFDEAKESYFNALERLASFVRRGYFPKDEMRRDYHESIRGVVRAFPDDFRAGTPYRNILKLHEGWQDQ